MKAFQSVASNTLILSGIIAGFCYDVKIATNLMTFWIWFSFFGGLLAALILFGFSALPFSAQQSLIKELKYPGAETCRSWGYFCDLLGIAILAATGHFLLAAVSAVVRLIFYWAMEHFLEESRCIEIRPIGQ